MCVSVIHRHQEEIGRPGIVGDSTHPPSAPGRSAGADSSRVGKGRGGYTGLPWLLSAMSCSGCLPATP